MSKFKRGDKVILINDNVLMFHKSPNRQEKSPHKRGRTTTVRYVDCEGRFVMQNDCDIWHYESDWELVKETYFKVGEVVECINAQTMGLAHKEEYIVLKIVDSDHMKVNGGGANKNHPYHQRRFRKIFIESQKDELIKKEMEDKTIEEIKNFDKSILEEANKAVLEEIANEKVEQAKKALRSLYDEKAVLERDTKIKTDKIKEITKDLKVISA